MECEYKHTTLPFHPHDTVLTNGLHVGNKVQSPGQKGIVTIQIFQQGQCGQFGGKRLIVGIAAHVKNLQLLQIDKGFWSDWTKE